MVGPEESKEPGPVVHLIRGDETIEELQERYLYKTPEDRAWWDEWRATRFCGRVEPWQLPRQLEMFE